jgi:hypothetical protein
MRTRLILAATTSAVLAVVGCLCWRPTAAPPDLRSQLRPGVAAPAAAVHTADAVLSTDPKVRLAAVTPQLAQLADAPAATPAGTAIRIDADGWREHDGFAVATATLTVPGQPDRSIVIGFQRTGDRWLIAFEEDAR